MSTIDIYQFSNYRLFLKEKFQEMKAKNRHFSYRVFNRLAGLKSSSHLMHIMTGRKNMGDGLIVKVAKGFKLTSRETDYLERLVKMNQSKTHEERDRYLKQVLQIKKPSPAKVLESAQYHLYSHWYYVAIFELLRLDEKSSSRPAKKDVNWIRKNLHTPVPVEHIRKALDDLQKLGLAGQNPDGSWIHKDAKLTTPDLVRSVAVTNFHVQMSEMASRAVHEVKAKDREFSSLTIAISEEAFGLAKKEIQEFRKKLHGLLEENSETTLKSRVVQVNLQMFSLSRPPTLSHKRPS